MPKTYTEEQIIKAIKKTFQICDDVVMGVNISYSSEEGEWQKKLIKDFLANLK